MLQSHAIQKFHGDEGLAVFLTDVVDGADIGVIQRRGGLSLALKTSQSLRIAGDIVRQKFQRYEPVETSVFGLIYNAHASAPELLDDAIVRDGLADHLSAARVNLWRILRWRVGLVNKSWRGREVCVNGQ